MDPATLLRWFGMVVVILASLIFIIQWLTPKLRKLFCNNTQCSNSQPVDVKTGEEEKNEEEKREENKASSRGSASAETGVVKSMTTRAYQAKQSPSSSTGTKPRRSQVTTMTTGRRGRVRGPMDEPHQTILKENMAKLSQMIKNDLDKIICSLRGKNVFDDDDKEMIDKETIQKNTVAGAIKLLDILLTCGEGSLQLFMECLVDHNCIPALEPLESAISDVKTGEEDQKMEAEKKKEEKELESNRTSNITDNANKDQTDPTPDVKTVEKKEEKNEEETKKKEKKGILQKFRYKNKKTQEKKEEAKELEPNRLSNITDVYNANKDQTDPTPDKGHQREPSTFRGKD